MKRRMAASVLATIVLASGAVACGEDDAGSAGTPGNGVDRAFVLRMIPHHESAVDMAHIAQQRTRRQAVRDLANAIVETQNAEIREMRELDRRLRQAGVKAGDLGVAEHEMGMDAEPEALLEAAPFERAFIDAMITHHQGAIHMARAQLAEGENPDLKRLADAIVDAQSKEIDEMNTWRVDWYGELSPAGGVPAEEEHSQHG
jgi:uncharacterized protein (DUF305 family)